MPHDDLVPGAAQSAAQPAALTGNLAGDGDRLDLEQAARRRPADAELLAADGRIVDANLAACRFYGYDHAAFCGKHTWEINSLGRDVLPIMNEVAKLSGGHRPLNFVHRMADGSLRDVQTYAGPLELNGKRLMLSIIHDVTEQKRLKNELQLAASRDHLTGLWNPTPFHRPARQGPPPEAAQRPRLLPAAARCRPFQAHQRPVRP